MGETVIEKIIRNNVGKTVKPGDIVTVNVDRVMIHDIFIPFVAEKFEEMGFTKLWDPDKAVLIYDPEAMQQYLLHFLPGIHPIQAGCFQVLHPRSYPLMHIYLCLPDLDY